MDNHLFVLNKRAGVLVQGDNTGDISLLDHAKKYLKEIYSKPGNVFLGLVHRLDRPVSGTMVFARTSKAASRLSDQIRRNSFKKKYIALVQGKTPSDGTLVDRITRSGATSKIAIGSEGKRAELSFKRLKFEDNLSFLEVDLKTGRHHQIRVQLANLGFPIVGDFRYGSKQKFPQKSIALHARELSFLHPVKKEPVSFQTIPQISWPLI